MTKAKDNSIKINLNLTWLPTTRSPPPLRVLFAHPLPPFTYRVGRNNAVDDAIGPANARHKIVVMGAAKVGKTSIITQFLYNTFTTKYKRTIEEMHQGNFSIAGVSLTLDILDTAGSYEVSHLIRLPPPSSERRPQNLLKPGLLVWCLGLVLRLGVGFLHVCLHLGLLCPLQPHPAVGVREAVCVGAGAGFNF